ncbi:MAG: tetratricopeptide repeat protein [Burkholderiales bacterium]
MKKITRILIVLLVCATSAWAVEQEETYTDLVPGQGMLDPAGLARLIQNNDVRAMNNVALLWAKGYDGKQSYTEAMLWWKEAARRGYTVAMNNIGLLYANGHGVAQDFKQALEWWHQSAFLGNAWAMNNVGDLYENGLGVEQSLSMAMTWYKSAAEQGEPLGMYNVGLLYEAGKGVARDDAEALSWFRKSADKAYASAMHRIGAMYRDGRAVSADPVEALAWFRVADGRFSPQDADEAAQNHIQIEKLSRQMGAAELERALERAKTIDAMTRPALSPAPKTTGSDGKAT